MLPNENTCFNRAKPGSFAFLSLPTAVFNLHFEYSSRHVKFPRVLRSQKFPRHCFIFPKSLNKITVSKNSIYAMLSTRHMSRRHSPHKSQGGRNSLQSPLRYLAEDTDSYSFGVCSATPRQSSKKGEATILYASYQPRLNTVTRVACRALPG